MKPGILSNLNRNLCLRLQSERTYVLKPAAPLLRALADSPSDTRLLVPEPGRQLGEERAPEPGIRQRFRKAALRTGLLLLIAVLNLGLLGFERLDRTRERHLLGRAIAEREQCARTLIEVNRHLTGVARVQNALLQQHAAGTADVLARTVVARRVPTSGI
jgi:hypothetical protein